MAPEQAVAVQELLQPREPVEAAAAVLLVGRQLLHPPHGARAHVALRVQLVRDLVLDVPDVDVDHEGVELQAHVLQQVLDLAEVDDRAIGDDAGVQDLHAARGQRGVHAPRERVLVGDAHSLGEGVADEDDAGPGRAQRHLAHRTVAEGQGVGPVGRPARTPDLVLDARARPQVVVVQLGGRAQRGARAGRGRRVEGSVNAREREIRAQQGQQHQGGDGGPRVPLEDGTGRARQRLTGRDPRLRHSSKKSSVSGRWSAQ